MARSRRLSCLILRMVAGDLGVSGLADEPDGEATEGGHDAERRGPGRRTAHTAGAGCARACVTIAYPKDGFYRLLQQRCAGLRRLADPARERDAWAALLAELEIKQPGEPAPLSRL
jgi:hypothetical protein